MTPYRAAFEIYLVFFVWWVLPLSALALWERYGHLRNRVRDGRWIPYENNGIPGEIRILPPGELDNILANGKIIMQDTFKEKDEYHGE